MVPADIAWPTMRGAEAGVTVFDAPALRATLHTFRDLMRRHCEAINRLNVYPVPDGDTGTNMARTLDAVVAELDGAAPDMDSTADAISLGSLMGARGNSGVILSQILRGLAQQFKGASEAGPPEVAAALAAASAAAYQAVLRPIEGTILTVARRAAEAGGVAVTSNGWVSIADVFRTARDAAAVALDETPELLPVLKDAGVVDAGGAGFLLLLDSALHVVAGEALPEAPEGADAVVAHPPAALGGDHVPGVADLRYEVMYLLDLADEQIEAFKHGWGEIGDSIVVVGGDGLWNCHVHTNDIGAAVEVALDCGGRPKKIRVTDLFEEVAEEHLHREAAMQGEPDDEPLPAVTTAVVAVASGPGLEALFRQLGVQRVVTGGQTLNPSTAELLAAVEAVNAEQVIVLPNNKNIIPVAEQIDALTTKDVRVVPTRSMPEALASLVLYDPEADVTSNSSEMSDAAASVAAGELTQSVRDTQAEVGPIREGDWIGIVRGDGIVAVSDDLLVAAQGLLDHLLTDDRELLTMVAGRDAHPGQTELLRGWLANFHPGVHVEVHLGGQPLYPYLFGAE